jgi:hypothetical protein
VLPEVRIAVGIATSYGLDGQGSNPNRGKILLFSTAFTQAVGPTQPPMLWILEATYPRVKQLGCEADHSPPPTAEVKNGGATRPLPHGFMT